jgi:hypothetical protein
LQLDDVDGRGRSVLNVAIASNATKAALWISQRKAAQRISLFVVSSIRRRRAVEEANTRLRLVIGIQARRRAYLVRRVHLGKLLSLLQDTKRVQATWGHVLSMVEKDGVLDGDMLGSHKEDSL